MHAFEGLCLCKMFRCPRGAEEDVATWSRRRYAEARRKFQEMGFASLVQRFLRVSWNLAKDMCEFIHVIQADIYDEWRNAGRTWRDVRACLCAYGVMWDRIRTDASEFLRMNFYSRESSQMKRQRGGGLAIGQRHWTHTLSKFFGPKWWEDFRATPGTFEQFAAHVCSREMLDCFQIRAKTYSHPRAAGEVHIQTQQELQEYGVEEGSHIANDRLAKRLAVHTSKWENAEWDLEAFGVPISIHGDSLLVVSWCQGYWQVINKDFQRRVDRIINRLDGMSFMFRIRPFAPGRDLIEHCFREWNTRADVLTHTAREGIDIFQDRIGQEPNEISSLYRYCGIDCGFDGGVSTAGVGVGCWIDVGRVSRTCRKPSSRDIVWTEVYSAAFSIDNNASVTDAELSAIEHIIDVLPRVLHTYFEFELL